MSIDADDGIAITLSRTLAAPPERVFRAFTDPADAAAWMWGSLAANPSATIDLRVGGRYRVEIDATGSGDVWPGSRWAFEGVYVIIDPPHRLVYTVHWDAPVGYNQGDDPVLDEAIVADMSTVDGGTRLVLRHVGIPDDGISSAEHANGVDDTLEALAGLVEAE
jgi:uncharacterized protein YndB with AHSA1/START domain